MIDEENQLQGSQSSTVDPSEPQQVLETPVPDGAEGEVAPDVSTAPSIDLEFSEATGFSETQEAVDESLEEGKYSAAAMAELENEISALRVQLEERTNQCVRIAADFDNYRKRNQREREELEQQVKCSTINELLPVVDNFERARSQIKPQTEQETSIHKSYQSVYKQLVECLKRIGVAPMRSEGKEFDPNLHEAVMRQPTSEHAEGTVMEELQRGYMLGERVLRHALVKVAAAPEPGVNSEGADQGEPEE